MAKSSFELYVIDGGHRSVEGWIEDGALSFLMLLNQYQRASDLSGAVAEIGVHHGRCFIALSAMRLPDEFGVAADIFENQALNPDGSGHGDRARFVSNLEKFGVADRQAIMTRDSLELTGGEIIDAAQGQQIRLFSVDGSHTAKHTANDLTIAQDALAQRGVVVLDDWFNPDWPGVQEGFFDFMRQRSASLSPFAYGSNKLYLTKRESYAEYLDFVNRTVRPLATYYKKVVLSDSNCHHLLLPPPDSVAATARASTSTELDVASPSPISGTLGAGWSEPEPWGRWTIGSQAEFTMILPPGGARDIELGAELASFFSEPRNRQVVTVSIGSRPGGEWTIDNTDFEWKRLSIRLPSGFAEPAINVRLSFLTTMSPKSAGLSSDERQLGVRVRKLTLRSRWYG
jgi:hypothetical protein